MSLIPSLELARFPPANVLHTQLQLHHQMLYRQHNITHHHHHPDEMTNNGWLLPPTPGAGPTLPGDVTVSLQNAKLWQQFHSETTEMIITKLGRRMFPSLQLQIDGLERRARYCLLLEVAPASRRRHKYVGGGGENGGPLNSRGWTSAGPAEPQPHVNRRVYLHPDSPATGTHWMQHPVGFNKLKLTNNAVDHHSNVVLTSMHKYVPRIWIVRCDDIARLTSLFSQPASSFCFPETEFIAVTAYQNENITKLKIDNNPFAKGFRETGQSRCKRKMQSFDTLRVGVPEEESRAHYVEDEESNISSSESESNRFSNRLELDPVQSRRVKRAASETGSLDDSGVSSSGSASPPLIQNKKEEGRGAVHPQPPRLHRPWTDENENENENENDLSSKSRERSTENRSHDNYHPLVSSSVEFLENKTNYSSKIVDHRSSVLPNKLQNIYAMELARIRQIQHYQQQIHYEQYCQINQIHHINQINQLKNLALQIPLPFPHTNSNAVRFNQPLASPRVNKFHNYDINHSPLSTSSSPAHSPIDGAS